MGQRVLLIFFQKAVPSSGFHLSRWKQQTPLDSSHFLLLHIQSTCQVLLSLPLKQILNLFPSLYLHYYHLVQTRCHFLLGLLK